MAAEPDRPQVPALSGHPAANAAASSGNSEALVAGASMTSATASAGSALSDLFRAQYDQLLRFCRLRIRNRADAEDIVQSAFLAARRAYPGKGVDELKPLLFTLVRNRAINHLKSASRHRKTFGDFEEAGERLACARSPTPERQVMSAQLLEIAEAVIAGMPERQREALRLHRFEGLTYDEIAARLSVSATTAKNDVARAVADIAEGLASAGLAKRDPAG